MDNDHNIVYHDLASMALVAVGHIVTVPDDHDLCIQGLNMPEQANVKNRCEAFLEDILNGSQIETEVAYVGHEIGQRGSERELFVCVCIYLVILSDTKRNCS